MPVIGQTLMSSDGSWASRPTSYSYHWQDCADKTYCVRISGATSKSYTVRANDFGYWIRSEVTACNARGCSSAFSPLRPKAAGKQPSGVGLPPSVQTDSSGTTWKEVGEDDFTVDAPLGSWRTSSPSRVVYIGDHGLKWVEYPDGWPCDDPGHNHPLCYWPGNVLSVHDGVLDFLLHDGRVPNGADRAMGADPSPLIPTTGTQYQTYGRYEARFKVIFNDPTHLDQYHIAWMLWPKPGNCAESDFPEMNLNRGLVLGFAHVGCRHQKYSSAKIDLTKWHTFTQEWGPGFRRYYLDGGLVGQSTQHVYRGPERWQLQTEAHNRRDDTTSGHL
ncbi:MAG: hypothetical protein ACTHQQ_18250, partial [Solirubrobacteraceae bacterium]